MIVRLSPWRGALQRALLLAVVVALVPLPVAAGQPGQAAKSQPLQASIAKFAAREVLVPTPAARSAQQGGTGDKTVLERPSFFKTKAGAIALIVVGAGTAYALYSTSHDRIHSTVRQ